MLGLFLQPRTQALFSTLLAEGNTFGPAGPAFPRFWEIWKILNKGVGKVCFTDLIADINSIKFRVGATLMNSRACDVLQNQRVDGFETNSQ